MTETKNSMNTKSLVYGALCLALSFALSYVKLFSMPMGGSVTLCSMLPLMAYAYRFGVPKGLLAGLAYGLLQLLQKPEIVHPLQLILDYPLAFMMLGFAGLMRSRADADTSKAWRLPAGIVVGGLLRMACHIVTGAVFFGAYAPEGVNAWWYSLLYNGGYLSVDTVVCAAVACIPPVRKVVSKL